MNLTHSEKCPIHQPSESREPELFSRLQKLGFTYDEAAQLRRIEMTLQRWGERECGDGSDWAIERDEKTGKPFMTYHGSTYANQVKRYAIADREAGALRRLAAIVKARNDRKFPNGLPDADCHPDFVRAYHQSDCRGCNLYLITNEQLTDKYSTPAKLLPLDQYYTRGLAVCA